MKREMGQLLQVLKANKKTSPRHPSICKVEAFNTAQLMKVGKKNGGAVEDRCKVQRQYLQLLESTEWPTQRILITRCVDNNFQGQFFQSLAELKDLCPLCRENCSLKI